MIPALLLAISGCGAPYDPPVQGDHTSAKYKTDLEKCRTSSTEAVRRRNADNPGSWMISPFTGPPAVRTAMQRCMEHDGYVLKKAGG
jgi:hypothetical protein